MVAAAGADELEHTGIAAFDATVHDADRLAPHECRPAVAGLTDKRECHTDYRSHAQPRVTAIVQMRRGDGGRTDNRFGTDHGVRVTKTAHSTHRQAIIATLPGSGAAPVSRDDTRRHSATKYPAELDSAWRSFVSQPFALASSDVLIAVFLGGISVPVMADARQRCLLSRPLSSRGSAPDLAIDPGARSSAKAAPMPCGYRGQVPPRGAGSLRRWLVTPRQRPAR